MFAEIATTVDAFDEVVGPALRLHPVMNGVELGIIDAARAEPTRYAQGVRLLALRDEASGEIGLAMQTPPHQPLVSLTSEAIARELGRRFAAMHPATRSVFGPLGAAHAFAEGAGARDMRQVSGSGVFELREVQWRPTAVGSPRLARPADADLLQSWIDAFVVEAMPAGFPRDAKAGDRMACDARTWLWCNERGVPVSMANNPRRVAGWWGVAYVYTPPEHRGRGHAGAVVSHLSQWALDEGAVGCTLFTDLANPVSNRLYERIGYRRVGTRVTLAW